MNREDGRAFLEGFRRAVNAALAFRIKDQPQAVAQAESAGTHGGDQVGVGINHDHAHDPRHSQHESRAKNLAGTYGEQAHYDTPRQHGQQNQGIDEALMVRAKKIRALARDILQPFDVDAGPNAPDQLDETSKQIND